MSAQNFKNLPETIEKTADITKEQLAFLLATEDDAMIQDLKQRARNTGDRIYGKNVYIRGLIEFTNYCKMTAFTVESAEVTATQTATG